MSGHSKWKNILHKKEKTDAQRAKIFTKIGREISVAVREGGADPLSNSKLKDCIAKAKANNVPNYNIKRIIEKASGGDGADYDTIIYEGYGPAGIAVIVETLTDNRNRTAASLRHYFDKHGGNLGATGCVAWQFDTKGMIYIEKGELNEDDAFLAFIDAGAEDIRSEEEMFEITTDLSVFQQVKEAIENKGYTIFSAEQEMISQNSVTLTDENDIQNMQKLLNLLEEDDDVQNTWHNWEE